jgi:hypothetical protein
MPSRKRMRIRPSGTPSSQSRIRIIRSYLPEVTRRRVAVAQSIASPEASQPPMTEPINPIRIAPAAATAAFRAASALGALPDVAGTYALYQPPT